MKFLNPCNDIAFKKIFGSESYKHITISFLNSLLEYTEDRTVTDIQFLNTEQKKHHKDKTDTVLDILCTDQMANKYIVQIQMERTKTSDKSMVYNGTKAYAMQLGKKPSYEKLMPVVVVAIVDFVMFASKKNYKSMHMMLDRKTYTQDLQELSFIFVELPKFLKKEHDIRSHEDKWLYLLKWICKKDHIPSFLNDDEFQEACNALEHTTWTEDELKAYGQTMVEAADIQDSLELAYENGEMNKAIEIARQLLDVLDVSTIAHKTGLSIEDIEVLKQSETTHTNVQPGKASNKKNNSYESQST